VARKRPNASDVVPPALHCLDGGKPDTDRPPLTRAEARDLRRSASVTHLELTKRLDGVPDAPPPAA
jgi:hypothetical protein